MPDSKHPAPALGEISKGLYLIYIESARYTFRDEEGKELFHVLRLEDKQQPGKKIVLPLSYGHCRGEEQEPHWSLKGYQSERRPLYNQQLLKEYPNSKVLIVEGKKSATLPRRSFPGRRSFV